MKIIKGIGNIIIAFLLCLALMGTFFIFLFSHTLLKEEYVLGQLEECHYYEKIETDLKNGFEEYQYQSGFPVEVFNDLYATNWIKEDINSMISHIYQNTSITNHAEAVKEQINQKISQYLSENNLVLNQTEQKNIDEFEKILGSVYENKINVFSKYADKIAEIISKVNQVMAILQKGAIGALGIILLILLLMNGRKIAESFSTMAISLLSAGILLELVNWVITKEIDINNILIFNQSLSDLIKEILYDLLSQICYFGVAFIVIGIFTIMGTNYYKVKKDN